MIVLEHHDPNLIMDALFNVPNPIVYKTIRDWDLLTGARFLSEERGTIKSEDGIIFEGLNRYGDTEEVIVEGVSSISAFLEQYL